MAWTLYKEIKYALDGIPGENLTDFPKLVSVVTDAEIAAELGSGGGIKFTSADGLTDLDFGMYPTSNLAAGTILARVKVTLLTAASVGDVICRLYYSSSESTTEDKAGTVSNGYALFMPLEEDPSGSAPQMLDWVSNTKTGTSAGSMTSGDLIAAQVGNGLDFDNSNDEIALASSFDFAGDFYLSANFSRANVADAGDGIFGSSNPQYLSRWTSATNFQIRTGADTVRNWTFPTTANSTRYHLAIRRVSGTIHCYLNGTVSATGGIADSGQFNVDKLGMTHTASRLGGMLDEVRIASTVPSANWIAYEYTDDFDNADTFTLSGEQGGDAGDSVSTPPATITATATAPTARKIAATPVASVTTQATAFESRKTALTPIATATFIATPARSGAISAAMPVAVVTLDALPLVARKLAAMPAAFATFTATAMPATIKTTVTPVATLTATARPITTNLDTLIVFVSVRLPARRFVMRLPARNFQARVTQRI